MPIPSVEATTGTGYLTGVESLSATAAAATGSTGAAGASAFADVLGGAVDSTQQLQGAANELAIAAVTGDLESVHQATIASPRAPTPLEPVAGVRNKAVDSFYELMRMQA